MSDKTENRGAKKGENRGNGNQGRKSFERKLKVVTVRVFEDQCPVASKQVRELIDEKNRKICSMNTIEIIHHFTESMPRAAQEAVRLEAEKLNLKKVYAYNGDTPVSEDTFEICKDVDDYIFSVDKNGTIL
jgi:hypothetical protein